MWNFGVANFARADLASLKLQNFLSRRIAPRPLGPVNIIILIEFSRQIKFNE